MQLSDALKKRRSIRNFENNDISIQDLNTIVKAGTYAPSAKNRQPWYFYIIQDKVTRIAFIHDMDRGIMQLEKKYRQQNIFRPDIESAKCTIKSMKQASAIIIVACRKKYKKVFKDEVNWFMHALDIEVTDILSIGAAIQNMLLKATEMEYGTLWVCDIFYAYPQIIDFLQTKDAIVSAICIGKSAEYPQSRPRLSLQEISCYYKKEYNE